MFYLLENHHIIFDEEGQVKTQPILINLKYLIAADTFFSSDSYGVRFDFGLEEDIEFLLESEKIRKNIVQTSVKADLPFDFDSMLEDMEKQPITTFDKKFISLTDITNIEIMEENNDVKIGKKILFSIEDILVIYPSNDDSHTDIVTSSNHKWSVLESPSEIYSKLYSNTEQSHKYFL